MKLLIDKKFRRARIWSNEELRKFAHFFEGNVVNVSGWKDVDKQGSYYKDYFTNADSYFISNYEAELKGFQGYDNEFFLDLVNDLKKKYVDHFDVVFNHTTLEHIYEIRKAFSNLCLMSKDIVIIVVPFLQTMHADLGDYWRLTPSTVKKLFEENNMKLQYLSFNNDRNSSVYIFAIATKKPDKWASKIKYQYSINCKNDFWDFSNNYVGCRAITNSILFKLKSRLASKYPKLFR